MDVRRGILTNFSSVLFPLEILPPRNSVSIEKYPLEKSKQKILSPLRPNVQLLPDNKYCAQTMDEFYSFKTFLLGLRRYVLSKSIFIRPFNNDKQIAI